MGDQNAPERRWTLRGGELTSASGPSLHRGGVVEVIEVAAFDRVVAERDELRNLLAHQVEDPDGRDACWHDHNGRCQAHALEKPCSVAEARAFLAALAEGEQPAGETRRQHQIIEERIPLCCAACCRSGWDLNLDGGECPGSPFVPAAGEQSTTETATGGMQPGGWRCSLPVGHKSAPQGYTTLVWDQEDADRLRRDGYAVTPLHDLTGLTGEDENADARIAKALGHWATAHAADFEVSGEHLERYPYDAILAHAVGELVERGFVLRGPAAAPATPEGDDDAA